MRPGPVLLRRSFGERCGARLGALRSSLGGAYAVQMSEACNFICLACTSSVRTSWLAWMDAGSRLGGSCVLDWPGLQNGPHTRGSGRQQRLVCCARSLPSIWWVGMRPGAGQCLPGAGTEVEAEARRSHH